MPDSATVQLQLAPLGAGDLIDRAVRLYRRHLLTLMRIAAPPVVVTAIGWVLWTITYRNVFNASETTSLVFYLLLFLASMALLIVGHIFHLLVMGGAARNLVTHLLWNEPVTVRATYRAVRVRFWPLLGATLIVALWGGMSVAVAFVTWYSMIFMVVFGAVALGLLSPWLMGFFGIIGVLAATVVALWLLFFMLGRVAYVPQVLLVEGKGVWGSVSRSFSLAKGNVRRLMAMTLFVTFATQSALMILVVPLGWYGYLNGIDPFNALSWPVWYAIAYSVLGPLAQILLTPIWMLGLSLLYVDERVRHEGYDIELLASQRLGEMPALNVSSPFGTAIAVDPGKLPPPPLASSGKILGLG